MEREGYSQWDYFGARYYDHGMYRFTSVDPIINKKKALVNPQYWNLYAYTGNNPITYFDPDGMDFDYLADALAAQFLDRHTDMSAKEYYQIVDKGKGIGAAIGFALYSAVFTPEIIAGLSAKYGDKIDPNKLHHVFGKPGRDLTSLLNKFGGNQLKAFKAVEKATQRYVDKNAITGIFKDISIKVKSVNVTVRGRVIDGKVKISTFFK